MDLYDVTIPMFIKSLTNLQALLRKGETWVKEKHMTEKEVLEARLYPDMFPLVRQVQIASDVAKSLSARLVGLEPPKMEDVETTFSELVIRCQKTIDFLFTLKPEQFRGAETKHIPFPYVPDTYLLGLEAVFQSYLPNFFFHMTTAYDILRHVGVPVGKADYIGDLPLKKNVT